MPLLLYFIGPKHPSGNCYIICFLTEKTSSPNTETISWKSFQITTLKACITLKIQSLWLWKVILSLFIHVKSIKVKSGFNLIILKNPLGRRHRRKVIKTNLKTLVSPLLRRPQELQWCQKNCYHPLNSPLKVWCAKIDPKLHKIQKTFRKHFWRFCFQFWRFFLVYSILAQY